MDTDAFPADRLPDGWEVWSDRGDGRVVLAFRPARFDGDQFPAACLPTIYLSTDSRRRPNAGASDEWVVVLSLEPEVELVSRRYEDRMTAVDGTVAVAERFVAGELDHRAAYHVPRDAYLDELDRLLESE